MAANSHSLLVPEINLVQDPNGELAHRLKVLLSNQDEIYMTRNTGFIIIFFGDFGLFVFQNKV